MSEDRLGLLAKIRHAETEKAADAQRKVAAQLAHTQELERRLSALIDDYGAAAQTRNASVLTLGASAAQRERLSRNLRATREHITRLEAVLNHAQRACLDAGRREDKLADLRGERVIEQRREDERKIDRARIFRRR